MNYLKGHNLSYNVIDRILQFIKHRSLKQESKQIKAIVQIDEQRDKLQRRRLIHRLLKNEKIR